MQLIFSPVVPGVFPATLQTESMSSEHKADPQDQTAQFWL